MVNQVEKRKLKRLLMYLIAFTLVFNLVTYHIVIKEESADQGKRFPIQIVQPQPNVILPKSNTCYPVYFWGGGKSGTTNLAVLLNNAGYGLVNESFAHNSPFPRFPKEICWAKKPNEKQTWDNAMSGLCKADDSKTSNTTKKEFLLDGCPQYHEVSHAKKIMENNPNARFFMLVRNPIDRMISHLNDNRLRFGQKINVQQSIKSAAKKSSRDPLLFLSKFGEALENLLKVVKNRSQILVILSEAMHEDNDVQKTFDAINDHIGSKRRKLMKVAHANRFNDNSDYQTIDNETREQMQAFFEKDVELLESLVGRRMPWSWTDPNPKVDSSPWLFTIPKGLP